MTRITLRLIKTAAFSFAVLYSSFSAAQVSLPNLNNLNLGEIHGNFQANAQYYIPDSTIGAAAVPEKMLMNGFMNLIYTKGKFTAGIRYESYLNALQGYPAGYKGNGIPYRFATYRADNFEVTGGNFYEQFGSGLTLRCYEERNLGLDNALDGFRIKYEPVKGLYLKGLIGKQRTGFTTSGLVRGFDGEIQLNEAFKKLADKKTIVTLGGSFVSKYQADADPTLVLPENVGNSAGRFSLVRNNFSMNGEYAYKINDPSLDNGFNYKYGDAALLQMSYAVKGFAFSVSGSRIDNMSYRSDRNAQLTNLLINYIPALPKQHTYQLLAFYPYASQARGEMEYSSELKYKIKKGTPLGGTYGTEITLNYSGSNGLDTAQIKAGDDKRHYFYKSNYFGFGKEVYFRDLYAEVTKKINKTWKGSLIYSHQIYNKSIIQKPGSPTITTDIAVADITYKLKPTSAIRVELQNMSTNDDHQDWAYVLLEYTINESWFVAAGDLYNYGNDIVEHRYHYYMGNIGFTKGTTRMVLSYGKQREGIFCVGGVCRNVPASNGLTLSITSSF
ncbi:MAG: DUF6029 family protein [Bacteroidia bacterium]